VTETEQTAALNELDQAVEDQARDDERYDAMLMALGGEAA